MEHSRRKRRSAEDIEKAIMEVATRLIKEKGFNGLTATGIMQQAAIEPVQFYRRYTDLNGFIDEYVKRFDYWFSDVTKPYSNTGKNKEQYEQIVNGLLDALMENKIMQELLRWEVADCNETSRRTARLRELHTLPLCAQYAEVFKDSDIDIVAVSALLIGGIYYLVLHKELAPFSKIDVNAEADRERIHKAIRGLSELLFDSLKPSAETIRIAREMKQDHIPVEKIAQYTKLSEEQIASL